MKQIKAFLRPQMLDAVIDAVEKLPGAPGLTVSTVKGFGHRSEGAPAQMTERVKLEIVVPEDDVAHVVAVIEDRARTGRTGDGKVFIAEVAEAVRIRTGERGEAAVRPAATGPEGD